MSSVICIYMEPAVELLVNFWYLAQFCLGALLGSVVAMFSNSELLDGAIVWDDWHYEREH